MTDLPHKVKAVLSQLPPFRKVVVGLSGGMDSVTLTHVLRCLGYEVIVAHLNHNLRGQASQDDEDFVVELARAWKIPYLIKKTNIPKTGNLEDQARHIRYAYLEEVRQAYQADYIAVGHHFDDQIETILMHQKRGSGLRGLRGMQLISGKVIRPLLEVSRPEIEAYVKEKLLDFRVDESNFDLNFERNHLRHQVIPKLKEDPEFEAKIRQVTVDANKKLTALQHGRKGWLSSHFKGQHFSRYEFNKLERDLKVEILLHLVGQKDLYASTLARLIDFIENGKTGKELLVKQKVFRIEYDQIHFLNEEELALPNVSVENELEWGDYHIKVKQLKALRVRTWQPGDKFQPAGMQGHKKLQDFFVDQKIPRHQRQRIPIVVNEKDEIICVGDLRFSEAFKAYRSDIKIKKKK